MTGLLVLFLFVVLVVGIIEVSKKGINCSKQHKTHSPTVHISSELTEYVSNNYLNDSYLSNDVCNVRRDSFSKSMPDGCVHLDHVQHESKKNNGGHSLQNFKFP